MKRHIPFRKGTSYKIQNPTGRFAHENFDECRYAMDFIVKLGTPVVATDNGTVYKVKNDSETNINPWNLRDRSNDEMRDLANEFTNFVAIQFGDGTFAEYLHLDRNTQVKEGDDVVRGETVLGYVGMSGITSEPHLHYNEVEKVKKGVFISKKIEFDF